MSGGVDSTAVEREVDRALPAWAIVHAPRRAHIARVVALLTGWASAMGLSHAEAAAWYDAAILHDAYRDADDDRLLSIVRVAGWEPSMLHGPAAATQAGTSTSPDVLDAVRWHTVGCATWSRVGRALYMADFLEPGRPFGARDRAFLAAHVPHDFDGVFRQVVRLRLDWAVREGRALYPETVAMWNAAR